MFVAMAILVNTAEFRDRLSEFLEILEMGGEVIICRRNVPLAKVESMRKPAGGVQGARRIQNASEYLEEELFRLVGCMV